MAGRFIAGVDNEAVIEGEQNNEDYEINNFL